MKKIISILICFALLISILCFNSIATNKIDNFTYEINEKDNTVIITEYDGDDETVNIPSSIDGNTVSAIKEFAFSNCRSIKKIFIPDSIMSIGYCAFGGCTSLNEIVIDENNTEYVTDNNVIYNKNKTKLVCYPSGLENTKFIIPDFVTSLEMYAFSGSKYLKEVELPNSIIVITHASFLNIASLESIKIPESITSIENFAFNSCSSLQSVYYDGTVEQWNKIKIADHNKELLEAELHTKEPEKVECTHQMEFTKVIKEATCEYQGEDLYTCKLCGHSTYVNTPVTDHKFGEWVVFTPATVLIEGVEIRRCECGESETRPIPKLEKTDEYFKGDVNGDGEVTSLDARKALRYSVGLETYDSKSFKAADINGDGEITSLDARKILRCSVGLEVL